MICRHVGPPTVTYLHCVIDSIFYMFKSTFKYTAVVLNSGVLSVTKCRSTRCSIRHVHEHCVKILDLDLDLDSLQTWTIVPRCPLSFVRFLLVYTFY